MLVPEFCSHRSAVEAGMRPPQPRTVTVAARGSSSTSMPRARRLSIITRVSSQSSTLVSRLTPSARALTISARLVRLFEPGGRTRAWIGPLVVGTSYTSRMSRASLMALMATTLVQQCGGPVVADFRFGRSTTRGGHPEPVPEQAPCQGHASGVVTALGPVCATRHRRFALRDASAAANPGGGRDGAGTRGRPAASSHHRHRSADTKRPPRGKGGLLIHRRIEAAERIARGHGDTTVDRCGSQVIPGAGSGDRRQIAKGGVDGERGFKV